jgi:hypothetical protein
MAGSAAIDIVVLLIGGDAGALGDRGDGW